MIRAPHSLLQIGPQKSRIFKSKLFESLILCWKTRYETIKKKVGLRKTNEFTRNPRKLQFFNLGDFSCFTWHSQLNTNILCEKKRWRNVLLLYLLKCCDISCKYCSRNFHNNAARKILMREKFKNGKYLNYLQLF